MPPSALTNLCVFCSASGDLAPQYVEVAATLGLLIAERGATLVYGGASVGLMGEVARAVHRVGGRVVGVIPKMLLSVEFAYRNADELIVTEDMRERKATMAARADAFLVLPGGIGTLEELFEIMTLRALNQTAKPLVLINTAGFYDPLHRLLERMSSEGFLRRALDDLYYLAADAVEALAYLDRLPAPSE